MDKNIIETLFNLLPDDLKTDTFVNEIQNMVLNYLNEAKIIGNIFVVDEIYERICKTNIEINMLEKSSSANNLLFFMLLSDVSMINFKLKQIGEDYIMEVTLTEPETHKQTTIKLFKTPDISKVETIEKVEKKGVILDYNYDVYYYDAEYNLLPKDLYLEHDRINHFMEVFCISENEAIVCSKNFKMFAKYLSDQRTIDLMKFCDDELYVDDKYKFKVPFCLNDFELFITKEMYRDSLEMDDSLRDYEITEPQNFDSDRVKAILEPLKAQIGEDGEIIVSSNIYDNFCFYLLGFAGTIYTNGFIIKKLEDTYTLYYLNIAENNLTAIPQVLSKDELDMIYNKHSDNEFVPGLKEFFGISRDRK